MIIRFTGPSHGFIELDNQRLNFYIKNSSRHTTRFRYVLVPEQELVITKPRRSNAQAALEALKHNETWLRQALEHNKPAPAMYLGEPLKIIRDVGNTVNSADDIVVIPKCHKNPLDFVVKWYKRQAAAYLLEKVPTLAQSIGVCPAKVSIRDQRTRWGSCSSKGTLSFNWRLIMAPAWVFDAIIVHELAHLKELNHSANFWEIVYSNYSRYDEAKYWLRQNGQRIRAWCYKED